ncbi:MAG: hypothetical protein R2746_05070 [Acidimicrobiales bacterium]
MPTLAAPAPARRAPGLGDLGGGRLLALAAGATLAVVGFRAGVVPGGQVGVDVLLAAAGWWFGSGAVAAGRVARWGEALHRAWPGALAALVGALVWVLLTEDTSRDRAVRGAALALLGGYGNWHQLRSARASSATRTCSRRSSTCGPGRWPPRAPSCSRCCSGSRRRSAPGAGAARTRSWCPPSW